MDVAATHRAGRLLGAVGTMSLAAALVALMQWSASGASGALRAAAALAGVALLALLASRAVVRSPAQELAPGAWACHECAAVNEVGAGFCLACGAVPRVRHARLRAG